MDPMEAVSNYTLSGGTHQLTVNQRPLNATIQRIYDGGLNAEESDLSSFDALQGGKHYFYQVLNGH